MNENEENDDLWGFFTEEKIDNKTIRRIWLDKFSRDKSKSPSDLYSKYNSINPILFKWDNPNPSLSIKLTTQEINIMNSLNISVCIAGYRLVQLLSGVIKAEFHLLFCYGSVSYSSWKSFSEFNELAKIIKHIHSTVRPIFNKSISEWEILKSKMKWFKSLEINYLIKKSIYLGNFVQALLLESPSPGIIFSFSRK